jgi:hypothetical protein
LVVDQFAAWVARERLPLLPASGGFARLRAEGTWFTDVRFAHANTETAVGHASLHTGVTPREHGVVANDLWLEHKKLGILVDSSTRLVTANGFGADGSSAKAVRSDVVADRFKRQNSAAKVFSFSLKDRGAIFGGGRHPDLSLWYDSKLGQFVSSTAFVDVLPPWVNAVAGPVVLKREMAKPWNPLDPSWVASHALTRDEQPGESDYQGYGTVFPHQVRDSHQPFGAFRGSPETDRLLLNLALQALNRSPREEPVLLAVSLSANDYIGHWFGPDSFEAWDELYRLDAALGEFFRELDRVQGPQNWSVVLSADHGILPLPEVNRQRAISRATSGAPQRPGDIGGRVLAGDLELTVRAAADQALGKGTWIESVTDPYVYLTQNARALSGARRPQLRAAVIAALTNVGGIARVFDVETIANPCPPVEDESLAALVCRSVYPGVGGDFYVALAPGYFFDTEYVTGFGTSHGNASVYDRSVPLLVRAPGKVEPRVVIHEQQSFTLYSKLLYQLLGLTITTHG